MPIYTASLFEPEHHHGRRVAICRTLPPGAEVDRHLKFLAPPANLLWDYKQWHSSGEVTLDRLAEYKQRYWQHLLLVWDQLSEYLDGLPVNETETWLCWEAGGKFCHRNLLLKVVERDWPQHLGQGGGADVLDAIAAPGIAWACEHLKLKPIFTPIVPSTPANAQAQTSPKPVDRSQLLFYPDVANS